MTHGPTVIDLGVVTTDDPAQPEPPWPLAQRLRQWSGRLTTWAAAAMVVLLLSTVTGSAAQQPWLVPHLTIQAGAPSTIRFTADDERLYLSSRTGELSAHRLADGALLWEHSGPGLPWTGYGVVALTGPDWLVALDPTTGEPSWSAAGNVVAGGPGLLILHHWLDGSAWLTGHDRSSGQAVWSLAVPERWALDRWIPGVATALVTLTGEGTLSSYDLRTGELRARTVVDGVAALPQLRLIGETALVRPRAFYPATVAYDVASLAPRWQAELPGDLAPAAGCGGLLCVHDETGQPRALDPVTGAEVWSSTWRPSQHLPAPLFDVDLADGHVFLSGGLLAVDTGELAQDLTGWFPVWSGDDRLSLQRLPSATEPTAGSAPRSERMWFGRLQGDPPRLVVLPAVEAGPAGCVAGAGYLTCQVGTELRVYRLR